jgi:hypothetical protein
MDYKIEKVAEQAHEANRIYCRTIGDGSQKCWADCPQWQKDSALAGVKAVAENPEITPAQLHASWVDAKAAAGWVYGPVKDEVAKTHHCIVPYDELPLSQRVKDTVFSAVVKSALIVTGVHRVS